MKATFRQVLDALDHLEIELNEGADADAGFDGGEWSAAAHAVTDEEEREKLITSLGWTAEEYEAVWREMEEAR